MSNWSQLIDRSTEELTQAGFIEARTNAEYLALHTIGLWEKAHLKAYLGKEVEPKEEELFRSYINRRLSHEPLQYIIGETEFYGLRLYCSPAALIPRPETEILVEETIKEIAPRVIKNENIRVLDIGTGSGAIILAIASMFPACECIGIDISREALILAERNRDRLGIKNVAFHCSDFMKMKFETESRFDIVVSNPPYVPVEELSEIADEVRLFEPFQALTDSADGFTFYEKIAESAAMLLSEGGVVLVETEYKGAATVKDIFTTKGLTVSRVVKDLLGHDRVVVASVNS